MQHTDYAKLYEQHKDALEASSTFSDFISACPISDDRKAHYLGYAGGWADLGFRTHKVHGFVSRPLFMPEATSFSDIVDSVEIHPYSSGTSPASEKTGLMFVSGLRADKASYFGYIAGAVRYIRVRKDGRFFCHGIGHGTQVCTYAKPNKACLQVLQENLISDRWFSFELIKRTDGKLLVTGRDGHSIGSRWLALLPGDSTMRDMIDPVTLHEIEAYEEYEAACNALVTGEIVDLEAAKALGVEIRTDKY